MVLSPQGAVASLQICADSAKLIPQGPVDKPLRGKLSLDDDRNSLLRSSDSCQSERGDSGGKTIQMLFSFY